MRISDLSSGVCSSDLAEQAERKSRPPPLALCPIRHMFFRMLERADRRHDVGHQRLFAAAMAEILADRLREILCMIDEQRDRAVDAVAAHRQAFGHRRGEAVLLDRKSTRLKSSH